MTWSPSLRVRCEEKRIDDRPEEGGTLNSGGPESAPDDAGRHPKASRDQPQEDAVWTLRESDPPIVVRDGRTDHMAKGRAGRQSKHSTHHGRRLLPITVSSTLLAMAVENWFNELVTLPSARLPEEPCAGKSHAGICEGGTR